MLSAFWCPAGARFTAGVRRDGPALGGSIEQLCLGVIRPQAQFDQGAGIGGDFGLPSVVGLIAGHGGLGARVPFAAGFAGQVFLADEGFLDFSHAFRLDRLLSFAFPGAAAGAFALFARACLSLRGRRFARRRTGRSFGSRRLGLADAGQGVS